MKRKILVIGLLIIALASTVLIYSKKEEKDRVIGSTGVVEGTEVNLSSKIAGRISEFCCKEGDRVPVGHVVARLEGDDIKASVEQARAGVMRAKADISSSDAGIKNSEANLKSAEADIKNAAAEVEKARVQMAEAEKNMHRADYLYKEKLISNQEVDRERTSYESSMAAYSASEARLKATVSKKDASISQVKTSRSLLAAAMARLEEAEAALKLQEVRLKDTEITTPISGTVVFKGMETGEVVSPGLTILTVVDLEDLWVRADIEETLIGRVKVGDEAVITIDGMTGLSFKGKVAEIGKEADFATQRDVTRGRQDIKTFRVKIRTEDKSGTLKPGMTVMVKMPGKV